MKGIATKNSVFRSEEGKRIVRRSYEEILAQWPVSHSRRTIGGSHIIECGDENSEPLFLLHGTMSNSAAWMGDVAAWSRHFRVIAADLPGEPGLSQEERISPAGNGFELWLSDLLSVLGYSNQAVSIVGQSLGAFAALRFAVRFPERVKKLSMLTASGIAPARIGFMFRFIPLMLLGEWGARRIDRLVSYGVEQDPAAAEFGAVVSEHCKPLTEPIPVFSDEELLCLTMPVQFFGGDHDVLLNTGATIDRLKRFVPLAQTNLLEETGHVVTGKTDEILRFMAA